MMINLKFLRKNPLAIGLILLVCMPYSNQAQSVKRHCISSYGAIVTTNDASFEQTVGQPYSTAISFGNTTAILQGFQQPVVLKVETINSELLKVLNVNVYPNPAAVSVTIQSNGVIDNAIVRVTDINGKLILSEQVIQLQIYDINCAAWESGIYIITVSDKNQNISTNKLTVNK